MLCVLILYISGGTYSLKSTPNDILLRGSCRRNIFYIFRFAGGVWPRVWDHIGAILFTILAKKIIFSDEALFNLGGYVNKENCRIWGTENPNAYIETPTHPKRITVWCGFWSRSIIGPFCFENEQGEAITVNGVYYRAQLNDERRILATFGLNRTVLRVTQPKLHSVFCVLFLKIALAAAKLMSFGHAGAAIWHRWTIICGVLSKTSVIPTNQRQLTL